MSRRRNKNTKRILPIIAIVILLSVGAYLYLKRDSIFSTTHDYTNSDLNIENVGQKSVDALSKEAPSGQIAFWQDNKINYIDLSTQKSGSYPIDIKAVSNSTSNDGTFIALTSDNDLIAWRNDKSVKTIANNNSFNPLPVISPKGNQMLVVSFSNAERDFGYTLEIWSTSNIKIKNIYSVSQAIIYPVWCNDNSVCFGVNSASDYQIIKVNADDGTSENVTNGKDNIVKYIACKNGYITYALNNKIVVLDNNFKAVKEIDATDIKSLIISPDGNAIIYLDSSNTIKYYNIKTQNSQNLSKASNIIGWFE